MMREMKRSVFLKLPTLSQVVKRPVPMGVKYRSESVIHGIGYVFTRASIENGVRTIIEKFEIID